MLLSLGLSIGGSQTASNDARNGAQNMFRVKRLSRSDFVTEVTPLLTTHEAENNLLLGLSEAGRVRDDEGAVWLAVLEGDQIVGAAVRTPPHFVAVSRLPPGAARVVADWFLEHQKDTDGAFGPSEHAREVAAALAERTGGSLECRMADTLYELTELREPPLPSGFARPASHDDVPTITRFQAEFVAEVNLPHPGDSAEWAANIVTRGRAYLWDDDGPRALACSSRRTPNGASIGPVYTPLDSRRRGYATALTADVARRVFASGKRFVCLFADRNNATSNHIYQSLGFQPRGDFDIWQVKPRIESA
jgi:predicted GNAT family acetyltransferase